MSAIVKEPRPKLQAAVKLFEQRLRAGAYVLHGIPGERKLASELGISYMSARKVVLRMVDEQVLQREPNGRLTLAKSATAERRAHIAFVAPAFSSQTFMEVQFELSRLVSERGGVVRPVTYVQSTDPVIFEALDSDFDGLFVILPVGAPQLLIDRLARARQRVVVLWHDFSHLGIPSIVTGPPRFVGKMLDHLATLGHRRVDCFNSLPMDAIVNERINHWRMGLESKGMTGELHNEPTEPFQCSVTGAYHTFKRMIRDGLGSNAYFCVTSELGRGAIRACHEAGLRVGIDVSLCGFSEIASARLTVPSLTTIEEAALRPYLAMGLEWIETKGRDWKRPLRLEPDDASVFVGESTGPCSA